MQPAPVPLLSSGSHTSLWSEGRVCSADYEDPITSPRTRADRQRSLRIGAAVVVAIAVVAVVFAVFGRKLMEGVADAAEWLRDLGFAGYALMFVAIAIACNLTAVFPVLYGPLVLIAGYTWGFKALLVTYPSALLGAAVGFVAMRRCFRAKVERMLEAAPRVRRVRLALGDGGLLMAVLLRLIPSPFGMTTMTMAVSPILTAHHFVATAVGLLRQIASVAVAQSVDDLGELLAGNAPQAETIAVAVGSAVVMLVITCWTKRIVDRRLAELDDERCSSVEGRELGLVLQVDNSAAPHAYITCAALAAAVVSADLLPAPKPRRRSDSPPRRVSGPKQKPPEPTIDASI
eukprot:TRINITY_DN14109_c1_g5_i1.p1 TRINITY_DN14109_c1_g5~~TRINITY_DN14109_c1_g5_i1.p1  ORF type:complete len:391 (+),score=111.76 TRINITY_DN14109_c1_g5_i1:136-1173(+)